ncbi:MAG: hypothetical protein ACJA1L_003757 [Paracoccaceae bacterium]
MGGLRSLGGGEGIAADKAMAARGAQAQGPRQVRADQGVADSDAATSAAPINEISTAPTAAACAIPRQTEA